jgi:hypothetical protein
MKRLSMQQKKGAARGYVISAMVFSLLILLFLYSINFFNGLSDRQNLDLTRQVVKHAVVQCYSIEGSYPPDVTYLEKNYGIVIDHDKFFVDYMNIASNIMPNIEVYEKY